MGDLEDIIKLILFLPVILIIFSALFTSINQISESNREQIIKPYAQTIKQKDAEIAALKQQINQLNKALEEANKKYERLTKENITKKDIVEIKTYYNITQTQINLLNQKFDIVNQNFITVYNQLFLYFRISVAINLFLVLFIIGDLISVTFFKVDIKKRFVEWLAGKVKKLRKNKKPTETDGAQIEKGTRPE